MYINYAPAFIKFLQMKVKYYRNAVFILQRYEPTLTTNSELTVLQCSTVNNAFGFN